jgi:pseudoazurin
MLWIVSAFVLAVAAAPTASAAQVVGEILNPDKSTQTMKVFNPRLVKVAKGDTVKWVATNPGHNVAFVAGGVPAGVPLFTSGYTKEITYKFEKPGIYVYKCTPHFGMGMVGLVIVGNDKSNLAAAKAAFVPPLAKKRLEPLFAELAK